MPTESTRKTHMVRITNPVDPSQYVDVKVIDEITFVDQHDYAQETTYTIDNSKDNDGRKVHAFIMLGSDNSSTLEVERIDQWGTIDFHDYGQETQCGMLGNGHEPPQHLKTHNFTVSNPSDPNIYVVIQRIDQLVVIDQHDYAQETIFDLVWSDDDMTNPSELDTSSDGTDINPPWRLDPFQNIVDVHWSHSGSGAAIYAAILPTGFTGNFNVLTPGEIGKIQAAGKNVFGPTSVILNPPVSGLYSWTGLVDGVSVRGFPYVPGSSPFDGGWFDGMTVHDARPAAQGGTIHFGFTSDGFFWNGNSPGEYPCPGTGEQPADCNPGPY